MSLRFLILIILLTLAHLLVEAKTHSCTVLRQNPMMSLRFLLIIIFLILAHFLVEARAECTIYLDPLTKPDIEVSFGSRKIALPYIDNLISIREGDTITAYCDDHFEKPQTHTHRNYISLKCSQNGNLHCNECYNNNYYRELTLSCSSVKNSWSFYETTPIYGFCSNDEMSYGVGKKRYNRTDTILGLCYNINQLKLGPIFHTMGISASPFSAFKAFKINHEIHDVSIFFQNEKLTVEDYKNDQFKHWVSLGKFETSLIVQEHNFKHILQEFGALFNIPWWPNLRLGNWYKYQMALTQRSKVHDYRMFTGASGKLTVPIEDKCNNNITMKVLTNRYYRHIPAYIWNYIQSEDFPHEKYVVIGFNSPFYEFHNETDIVFCEDICDSIDWLKYASKTFRYSSMGIIFCCTVEDVLESNILEGFLNVMEFIEETE